MELGPVGTAVDIRKDGSLRHGPWLGFCGVLVSRAFGQHLDNQPSKTHANAVNVPDP